LLLQDIEFNNLKRIDLRKSESITKVPNLCAPNLEELDLSFCRNLVGFHESIGSLAMLREWNLKGCQKLQNLPSNLMLKSLQTLDMSLCESLENFPNLCAPNLEELDLSLCRNLVGFHESIGSLAKLREWKLDGCQKLKNLPSNLMLKSLQTLNIWLCRSLEDFPFLRRVHNIVVSGLNRYCCKSLIDLPGSIYKLQLPQELYISSKIWRSYTGEITFKGCGFLLLELLDMSEVGNLIELDFLMKPDYFPVLKCLYLNDINIITIPESISKFTRLERLEIRNCKYLREIPRLPQSLRHAVIINCQLLDPISSNRLLSQVFLSLPILLKQFFDFLKNTLLDLF
jgi:hypothetical protein